MKMSDVFKDYELEYWGAFSAAIEGDRTYGTKTIAAMHATAKHDALVELNKELICELKTLHETMKGILEDPGVLNVYRCHFDNKDLESTRALIVKSERLNND